ncbi:MAG: FecR domain-containing protein [Spirochaetales bacterium]|nr:FecR domain-containing protein [Spirochaetales bacterium]
MNLRTAGVVLALTLVLPLAAAAGDTVGDIVYLEDGVSVSRNGQTLDPDSVYIGAALENYDLMRTDATGYAEVELTAPGSPEATVKVSPNTTFAFEINRHGKGSRNSVGLITGTLALKVQKLAGNQALEIATESALMGVRGTTFVVVVNPAGEVLVVTSEGQVSCVDESGRELYAEPGQVVEKLPGESFRRIPVAVSSLEQFQRDWYADRLEVFKANALKAIRYYGLRYFELRERFEAGYRALKGEREVLRRWYEEDRRGQVGGRMAVLRDKKALLPHLFELRKTLFLFERVYFRLEELERYHREGYGRGSVQPGLSSSEFFRQFDRDRELLERQMAEVRYITKLYALRNEGRFPTDHFEEGEEEFFGDEEDDEFSF